jgi:hypothetical protein
VGTLHQIHAAEAATEIGADDKYSAESGQIAVVVLLCSASLMAVLAIALFAAFY